MSEQPDTRERAKQEATAQVITILGAVVLVIVYSWQRKMSEPDHWRQQRMRVAKAAERRLAGLAAWAWGRAERARLAYERERDAP